MSFRAKTVRNPEVLRWVASQIVLVAFGLRWIVLLSAAMVGYLIACVVYLKRR